MKLLEHTPKNEINFEDIKSKFEINTTLQRINPIMRGMCVQFIKHTLRWAASVPQDYKFDNIISIGYSKMDYSRYNITALKNIIVAYLPNIIIYKDTYAHPFNPIVGFEN